MLIETIKRIVTEEKSIKEIRLPHFVQSPDNPKRKYAILKEGKYMEVDQYGILVWESKTKVKELASFEAITEAEFIAAYIIARDLTTISLQPIPETNGTSY